MAEASGLVESSTPCGGGSQIALQVAFDGRRFLALAFLGRFLVELTSSQLGQNTGFLASAFETAQSCVKVLAFSYSDARHRLTCKWLLYRKIGRLSRQKSGILAAPA
jgi:hypothetical protein